MGNLTVVCGSPGAGKSTYARTLAARLKGALLDIDTCTEKLVRVALSEGGKDPDDRDSPYFKSTYREVIYESLMRIAEENLSHVDVIIVGPFTRELRDQGWLRELRGRFSAEVAVHYVYCRPEVRQKRMALRAEGRDLAKLSDWIGTSAYYGEEQRPEFEHVFVDTTDGSSFS